MKRSGTGPADWDHRVHIGRFPPDQSVGEGKQWIGGYPSDELEGCACPNIQVFGHRTTSSGMDVQLR
jgi:hypothetical protein